MTPAEIEATPDDFEQPKMNCPNCGAEYDDFDGFGVLFCPECRYCQHASVTDGKCDYCGKEYDR